MLSSIARYTLLLLLFSPLLAGCEKAKETPVVNTPPSVILALGDSLTAGLGVDVLDTYPAQLEERLKQDGYSYTVQNAGVSGETSTQLLARLDWVLEGNLQPPALAIVEIGANDAFQGISPQVTRAAIQEIVSKLKARSIPVLLTGMKAPPNLGADFRNQFDALFADIAKTEQVPLMEFFLQDVAAVPSLNQADGIHPTKEGYALVVKHLMEELQKHNLIHK